MSKHTPGPWLMAGFNSHDGTHEITTVARTDEERELIASVVAYPYPPRLHEAEANAMLIAAAPELLEILFRVRRWVDDNPETPCRLIGQLAYDIDNVLSKASAEANRYGI